MYFVHILCNSDKNLKPEIGEIHCPAIFLYISYRLEQPLLSSTGPQSSNQLIEALFNYRTYIANTAVNRGHFCLFSLFTYMFFIYFILFIFF